MTLAPHKGQELRWLVKDKFAVGTGIENMLELFSAVPNKRMVCGYNFRFEYVDWPNQEKPFSRCIVDIKETRTSKKWHDLMPVLATGFQYEQLEGPIDRRTKEEYKTWKQVFERAG